MYELDKSVASFAVSNDFVKTLNKVAYQSGVSLKPFCFFADDKQKEYGVMDFALFSGLTDASKSLVSEISQMRREQYQSSGVYLPQKEDVDKTLFIDYLLTVSLCYIEVPKYVSKNGLSQQKYDKFLVTRNPAIMGIWMGTSSAEMQAKYSSRIQITNIDIIEGHLKVVKLLSSAKGNSISCPRKYIEVSKVRCVPLFMLYAFQKGFEDKLKNSILKFTYEKDNNTVRELSSSLSSSIISRYYDTDMTGSMLSGSDIDSQVQGGMHMSATMGRGYIRIPELGASKYDASGVRALNLARILRVEKVSDIDTTYIDVDLDSVISNFSDSLDYLLTKQPEKVSQVYRDLLEEEPTSNQYPVLASQIKSFVNTRGIIFSTMYHRQLHSYMVMHPDLFPLYTGKPSSTVQSSKNFGVEIMDF